MRDILAVQAIITRVAHTIDGRRWTELRALFADTVQTDYTSLFGGDVADQRADDLMTAWKTLLSPVVTQHLLGPVEVSVTRDAARAECHVRGYHVKGGEEWMVAGHYVFALARAAAGWQIVKMKLETLYQTGNRALLTGS